MENKEKVSWKETWQVFRRGVLLLNKYIPGLFWSIAACAVVSAVTPYVTVFFSARVLEELTGLRRPEVLWRCVAAAVGSAGALALAQAGLTRWKSARMSIFYMNRKLIYTDKLLAMDYADLEKQSTADQLSQIRQNEMWSELGLMQIPSLVEALLQQTVGIASAVVLSAGLFLTHVPEDAKAFRTLPAFVWGALDGPAGVLVLMAGIALPTAAGLWAYGKVMGFWQGVANAENARFSNRIFNAFGYLSHDRFRALDIRMYDQQVIARYHMSHSNAFSADGPIAKVFAGKGGLMQAVSGGAWVLATASVYLYVCLKAWAGAFGVGMATQYIGAVSNLAINVQKLLAGLSQLRHCVPYLWDSYEFLDIPNQMYQGSLTTEKRADRQYDVEFRDVSFRYPGQEAWALRHVSVKFRVGERLAVVGENGSGKSTFIKLLCRLYDPQEGEILLNGIDIRKYRYQDYIDVFSVVFQDFQLISQPLGANVAGRAQYDARKVTESLADAGFAERLASLPDGLDTQLYRDYDGEGVMISGGEAQKIAIARALHKNAPFIILDEPTAALDPIAEAEIYAQFNEISGDKTAIYISHRLSSCKFCDEILVFCDGAIVQQGTHESLLAKPDGKYYALWHAQAQYYT